MSGKLLRKVFRGSALSALLLGLALGLFTKSEPILTSFNETAVPGLSVHTYADYGYGSLRPNQGAAQRGPLVRHLRGHRTAAARTHRLWSGVHRPSAGRVQSGRSHHFGGHRLVQLRQFPVRLPCVPVFHRPILLPILEHPPAWGTPVANCVYSLFIALSICIRSVNRHEPYPGDLP